MPLHGMAYVFWILSMLPIVAGLWRTVRGGLGRLEQNHGPFHDHPTTAS